MHKTSYLNLDTTKNIIRNSSSQREKNVHKLVSQTSVRGFEIFFFFEFHLLLHLNGTANATLQGCI